MLGHADVELDCTKEMSTLITKKMPTRKYTVCQNLVWFWQHTHKDYPTLKWWLPVNLLVRIMTTAVGSGIPALLVWALNRSTRLSTLALIMIGLSAGLGLVTWLQTVMDVWLNWENANFRMNLFVTDGAGFIHMPYADAIDPTVQRVREESMKYGYAEDNSGASMIWPSFVKFGEVALTLVAIIVLTTAIAWWMPAVILVTSLLSGWLLVRFSDQRRQLRTGLDETYFNQQYIYDHAFKLENGKDVRLYQMADWYQEKVEHIRARIVTTQNHVNTARMKTLSLVSVLNFLRTALVYSTLVFVVWHGQMPLATFTFFFILINTLESLIDQGADSFGDLMTASADLTIGRRYLDYSENIVRLDDNGRADAHFDLTKPFKITFTDVSYQYPGSDHSTIDHLSFTIEPGERIALVGLNGAGKTTVTLLLMGLLKPTSGKILLNEVSTETIPTSVYRRLFAPVFQESTVLAETVAQNIAVADTYDKERVHQAIAQADMATDIAHLPKGIETPLTQYIDDHGVMFSGGQTQKLMLARALYRDAPIVILDEPTAALDAISESNLYARYQEIIKGKTSIFISHRLASTQFADRIFFLQSGRIQAVGTHAELMAAGGEYARLYSVQSQYYQEEGKTNGAD